MLCWLQTVGDALLGHSMQEQVPQGQEWGSRLMHHASCLSCTALPSTTIVAAVQPRRFLRAPDAHAVAATHRRAAV